MNLGHLVSIVQESRNLTAMVLPLPGVDDSVDYAITEAGEYMDAVLRAKRQGDKRNHDKEHDERKEWGQCGYMIASAMMQTDVGPLRASAEENTSVYVVIGILADIRRGYCGTSWLCPALANWVEVSTSNGWDEADLLRETCTAFERKHLPELFTQE